MADKKDIESWFNELGASRSELPYELVHVFPPSNKEGIRSSIFLALEHIDRILDFGVFSTEKYSDQDQLWFDVLARLDCYSYYAAMAIPMIRQVIEYKTNYINETIDQTYLIKWEGLSTYSEGQPVHMGGREYIINSYFNLVSRFSILAEWYKSLASPIEFAEWCKWFLFCCADLILLALRPSLLRTQLDKHM